MSVIRLVMLDRNESQSGLIPSHAISSVLFAVAGGASHLTDFWEKVAEIDPGLQDHYRSNLDPAPILEGRGDGLLVISWEHHCIESFQAYQPIRTHGLARRHDGRSTTAEGPDLPFQIPEDWSIIDHHFEESRH